MKQPTQLFIIGHAALASLTDEEVDATVAALKEVDLYRLPYERVSVRMQTDDCVLTEGAVRTADLSPRFNFWTDPKTGRMHSQDGAGAPHRVPQRQPARRPGKHVVRPRWLGPRLAAV
jgi:hypothetical protein